MSDGSGVVHSAVGSKVVPREKKGGKCIGLWGLRHSHFTLSPSLPTPSCSSRREEGRGEIDVL